MHSHRSRILRVALVAITLALTVAACGKKSHPLKNYPDGLDGFQAFANDWVAAAKDGDKDAVRKMAERAVLPNPATWFATTFGDEAGKRLLAEYTDTLGGADAGFVKAAPDALTHLVKDEGRTKAEVRRHDDAKDDSATGFQVLALRAMKQPVALYSLRLQRPDGSKVYSLWSFVYVDGAFRIAGKMKAANPEPMSDDLSMLSELPVKDARELLDEHR